MSKKAEDDAVEQDETTDQAEDASPELDEDTRAALVRLHKTGSYAVSREQPEPDWLVDLVDRGLAEKKILAGRIVFTPAKPLG